MAPPSFHDAPPPSAPLYSVPTCFHGLQAFSLGLLGVERDVHALGFVQLASGQVSDAAAGLLESRIEVVLSDGKMREKKNTEAIGARGKAGKACGDGDRNQTGCGADKKAISWGAVAGRICATSSTIHPSNIFEAGGLHMKPRVRVKLAHSRDVALQGSELNTETPSKC